MKRIIITILFLIAGHYLLKAQDGCKELDIMVIADLSGSVQGHEEFIGDAVYNFSDQPLEGLQIGAIVFNNDARVVCELTGEKEKILRNVLSIRKIKAEGLTNLSAAFYLAIDQFAENGRRGVVKVIVLISDGLPDNEDQVRFIAEEIQMLADIRIYTVIINSGIRNDEFMESISTEYFETDYQSLTKMIENINLCL